MRGTDRRPRDLTRGGEWVGGRRKVITRTFSQAFLFDRCMRFEQNERNARFDPRLPRTGPPLANPNPSPFGKKKEVSSRRRALDRLWPRADTTRPARRYPRWTKERARDPVIILAKKNKASTGQLVRRLRLQKSMYAYLVLQKMRDTGRNNVWGPPWTLTRISSRPLRVFGRRRARWMRYRRLDVPVQKDGEGSEGIEKKKIDTGRI